MDLAPGTEPYRAFANRVSKLRWVAILTKRKKPTLIAARTFYSARGNLPHDLLEVAAAAGLLV